ncbi:armadillo repeat-containing protein 6 homolog [Aphomia sociella]
MVRVITQETYDEVVKENIDEFEMTPEDAVKEAIAQFEAQGVDLSNIIKDLSLGSGDEHTVSASVSKLRDLTNKSTNNEELIVQELDNLKIECDKDIARRVRAGKDGAYTILIDLLESKLNMYLQDKSEVNSRLLMNILNTLTSLMDTQPDLLEARGIDLIKSLLDNTEDSDILYATLKWTSNCCTKHEMNKQSLFNKKIGDNLKLILKNKNNVKLAVIAMQVTRKFTLDDDVRVEFGKAHDHAKELAVNLLLPLTDLTKEALDEIQMAELLKTIASLLVRHELCSLVADAGICSLLFTILAKYYDNAVIVKQANKLITALAGNDDVKRKLMQAGIAPVVVSILNRHDNNATAAALSLKCISSLTLREPTHAATFFSCDAAEAVLRAMAIHPDDAGVQKNACWAIRNMVARYRDENSKFHDLGAEALLNDAYKKFHNEFGFDIKSALRDLECNVKLDEQWKGKGVQIDT